MDIPDHRSATPHGHQRKSQRPDPKNHNTVPSPSALPEEGTTTRPVIQTATSETYGIPR